MALGLSALIVASPQAFMALKIVGAGYLVWLAWQAITKGSAFSPDTSKREPRSLFQNWATGLGVNLLNPKIILFFMTFLPQFVSAHDTECAGKTVLPRRDVHRAVDPGHRTDGDRRRQVRRAAEEASPRVTRVVDYLFAGVFSAFALKIITAQAK